MCSLHLILTRIETMNQMALDVSRQRLGVRQSSAAFVASGRYGKRQRTGAVQNLAEFSCPPHGKYVQLTNGSWAGEKLCQTKRDSRGVAASVSSRTSSANEFVPRTHERSYGSCPRSSDACSAIFRVA